MMKDVYLLWHFREEDNDESYKLVGVYSDMAEIEAAKLRKLTYPGFQDYPDNFLVSPYSLNKDAWSEGFGV